jgi:acyl-homoserine-lactone acylase
MNRLFARVHGRGQISHALAGFSPVIGLTGTVQGLRTRLGNEMIAERVAGTDHLGAPKFTIATLQAMWQPDRSKLAELVLVPLVADCRAHPSAISTSGQTVDLHAACTALAGYNRTGSLNAAGGWLFSEWDLHFRTGQFWGTAFDPARPLSTPYGLDTANPETLQALADAVLAMKANGFGPAATYGQVQHASRGAARIPIHGCDSGCFNAIYGADDLSASSPLTQDPYGEVYDGSSLVMTTELTPGEPRSQGDPDLLPGHRPDLALVREHDPAVLAEALGQTRVHVRRAAGRTSAADAGAAGAVAQAGSQSTHTAGGLRNTRPRT